MQYHIVNPQYFRDPGESALIDGVLRVLPHEFWKRYTRQEIAFFCHRHGFYSIPTLELVKWLKAHIAGRRAIEIGSGHGVLAKALSIPATDSRLQEDRGMAAYYATLGQPPVLYGANVEKLDAVDAIRKYRPEVVIAAWVTHRYNPEEHWRHGNVYGVDEMFVIENAKYVFIGHERVHAYKPILPLVHSYVYPEWLVSRALSEGENFIAIWEKEARLK